MQTLPIDPLLPELCASLARTPSLVLEAPPGAGKTTRVPRAMLDHGLAGEGEIIVLEPRRLAARMAATRVADELGEEVAGTVGYKVRFEDRTGPRTRICFVTEGILTRRLLSDPDLRGASAVVLDEFHERHLHGDVALMLLRRLQRERRPDLRIVVMSATLASAPVAAFLDAPVLRSEGRLFAITIEHAARADDRPLELAVAASVRQLVNEGLLGDVLVFLPGSAEIRKAAQACEAVARSADLWVLPLHGQLSPAEQDRAVRPASRRKIILATNVAESSVTIDGVVAVIDSGLARVASHEAWSGLPTLKVARISRASATQRAGRAGRTRPGRCIRLYTTGDLAARPEHDAPEIARLDLAETALELFAAGATDLAALGWFEPPPARSLAAAEALLERLGAIGPRDARGPRITETGRQMLRFPVHPRQARMILEADRRGVVEDGCALAALAGEREIEAPQDAYAKRSRAVVGSDLVASLDLLDEAVDAHFEPNRLRSLGVDQQRSMSVQRVREQLVRIARGGGRSRADEPRSAEEHDAALRMAILAGFPDRVGRLRRPESATGRTGLEVVLAAGGTAVLAETSGVTDTDLLVAILAEQRSEGASARTVVRVASAIEADWLLDLFTDAVRDTCHVVWNASAERADVVRRLSYDGLVLEESRAPEAGEDIAAKALADAARAKGLAAFAKEGSIEGLVARIRFLRESCPELELPDLNAAGLDALLVALCEGRRSFAELRRADPLGAIEQLLTREQTKALRDHAPERVQLPGGRGVRVAYDGHGPPWMGSRLQDFFGMAEGPRIAKGRVPLVLHLLAPNQRAVQVTTDLAGFWTRHYPAIAKELRRKYPRHAWPDDPRSATPPAPQPPRR